MRPKLRSRPARSTSRAEVVGVMMGERLEWSVLRKGLYSELEISPDRMTLNRVFVTDRDVRGKGRAGYTEYERSKSAGTEEKN